MLITSRRRIQEHSHRTTAGFNSVPQVGHNLNPWSPDGNVYGPENGHNFLCPCLLRVKGLSCTSTSLHLQYLHLSLSIFLTQAYPPKVTKHI